MEKHRCKLCSRTFTNGRALGGHMKGHLSVLPLPPKPSDSASSWSLSSSSEEEDKCLAHALKENPKKRAKLSDPQFSAVAVVVVQDKESETESRNPTRKRSKRTRKSAFVSMRKKATTESQSPAVSSISDGSPEEDVALCLIMLSRDKWTAKEANINAQQDGKKFECEKCKKKFPSSKALAGHKASHKKKRDEDDDKDKIFECPFCFKMFGSGQALGGHKRSHLLGHQYHANGSAAAAAASCSSSIANYSTLEVKMNTLLIDLNFPAPVEQEDEYSVVSEVKIQC